MKFSKLLTLACILFSMNPFIASAQIAEQPCDTQFWRQMSARAWMEAEREIMQNQNLIFKPDSVLEYTCFDQFVGINAWDGGDIFVHTTYFGSPIISRGQPTGLEYAMTKVVSEALQEYKTENFNDAYLGGRAEYLGSNVKNSDFKYFSSRISEYTCDVMANVWRTSKCKNFIDNSQFEKTDGFYPFDDIVGYDGAPNVYGYSNAAEVGDPRQWPESMACGPQSTTTPTGTNVTIGQPFGSGGSWEDQIAAAKNINDNLYPSKTPLGLIYKDVYDLTAPGACADPILTGVTVIAGDGSTYPDGVCTNPGCSYSRSGTCIGSQEAEDAIISGGAG